MPSLQEDLEREIDRAAALQEIDGLVQVDVVARREDERALRVVAGASELLVAPVLDPIASPWCTMSSSSAADIPPPFRSG